MSLLNSSIKTSYHVFYIDFISKKVYNNESIVSE